MEDKCNMNVKQCVMHLTGRRVRMAGNVTIYGYKNILRGQ